MLSGHRFRRRMRQLVSPAAMVVMVAACFGCASTPVRTTDRPTSPLTSLRDAINSVLDAPNFTIVNTERAPLLPLPGGGMKTVIKAVIEKPDRATLGDGSSVLIAIGSIGYVPGPRGKWKVLHAHREAANVTNSALVYLHTLDRTTTVARHGDTYSVPPAEVVSLLTSTRLPELQTAGDATWSAIVRGGTFQSMTLHYVQPAQSTAGDCGGTPCTLPASPVTVTTTVSRVGTSPAIKAPSRSSIIR